MPISKAKVQPTAVACQNGRIACSAAARQPRNHLTELGCAFTAAEGVFDKPGVVFWENVSFYRLECV